MDEHPATELARELVDEWDGNLVLPESRKAFEKLIATALTRARAEGVREGVERAIEAIEKCKLRPNSMLSGTGMAAVHDGALNDALRALADSPDGREG